MILGGERRVRALEGRWRDLFDGESLAGWRSFTGGPPRGWAVEGGALARVGPGGDLVTVESFGDVELSFEWRLSRGGNSGVLVRVTDGGAPERARAGLAGSTAGRSPNDRSSREAGERSRRTHPTDDGESAADTGPELQLVDDARHPDGRRATTRCGALYGLYAPLRAAARPAGTWNSARIVARGPELTFVINDLVVVRAEVDSDDWRLRVARSKFADAPAYARARRGRIALQDHGDPVWFRAIRVRPAG